MNKTKRQYGRWPSPLTPALVAAGRRLDGVAIDSDGEQLVWLEGRSGQGVLVADDGSGNAQRDVTSQHSVRAEVGYGGGDFTVHDGDAYFIAHRTGRLFRQPIARGIANPITPAFGHASSPAVSPDGEFVAYVHTDEDVDRIAVVDTQGHHWPAILASGHDFYMQPRISPDGSRVAYVAWNHPNMPWDGTTLYVADLDRSGPLPVADTPQAIAGGDDIAIFQPEFSTDNSRLFFVSDETGWGRLASHDLTTGSTDWLTPDGLELGTPAWAQDMRTYAVCGDGQTIAAVISQNGFLSVVRIDLASGEQLTVEPLAQLTDISRIVAAPVGTRIAVIGSSAVQTPRIICCDLDDDTTRVVARSTSETLSIDGLSEPAAISWDSAAGETAHGLFYPPASESFEGTGLPPVIAMIHGGPTSQSRAGWKADVQYFTTRGWAVLQVNYRGSTGYGREYMLKLRGNWGICDVEDSISGIRHLVDSGQIDPDRKVIMGGSAGGFTVLQVMAHHPEEFTAGVNLYGVANQFHLASDTHKFESRYTDTMIGPLPETAAVYHERSPGFHAEKIRRPIAVFQGDIDRVVPRQQSDDVVAALERSGTPHVYHLYEGEGHGWRKQETIDHFYRAVEAFLDQHVLMQ
ncbi:MAG: prolyl oligopeptidase family serine peptidase [Planctomycetota bacterium]|nr:prolyl oligopeptidase family serine peptidase [Planctomycetota bacterium]